MSYEPYNPEVNFYPVNEPVKTGEGTPESPSPNSPANVPQETKTNVVPSGNGSILNGGTLQSPNFVTGATGSGWKLDSNGNLECNDGNFRGDITGASGTFSGTVTVNEINIGGDDASSAHIDSDGNFWTGASVANKLTAPVRINKDGTAFFYGVTTIGSAADGFNQISWDSSNLGINGSYVTNNDIYGDGSDGDVTIAADTSLSSDIFYDDGIINLTKTLNPSGFRIFCKGTLTINGKIARNGNNGTNGGNATSTNGGGIGAAGTGGAALADGSIKGALAGKDGVAGRAGVAHFGAGAGTNGNNGNNGNNGTDAAKSLATADGIAGKNGGNGGTSSSASPGNGGTGGTAGTRTGTVYNKVHNALAAYRLYDDNGAAYLTAAPSNGGSATGGTGGAWAAAGSTAATGDTGGSGGNGSNGGIILIFARKIVINGSIEAKGGTGGNAGTTFASSVSGASAAAGGSGGSSGGNGGNGGIIVLVYSSIENNGTISVAGGAGGTKASGGTGASVGGGNSANNGDNGTDGATGNDGLVIYLQV